jgi:NAD(P)-dependent dehydrogenase (short-subunit alcohol dehydrogenase family)
MRYEIPAMLKAGGGVIVNVSSILGWVGFATSPAYVAAKHGVIGLTKSAALEYGPRNIRVSAVSPGFITTPLIEKGGITEGSDIYNQLAAAHAMKRLGKPEEVSEVIVWLCSDMASFMTGSAVLVDGGYVAS